MSLPHSKTANRVLSDLGMLQGSLEQLKYDPVVVKYWPQLTYLLEQAQASVVEMKDGIHAHWYTQEKAE